MTYETTTTTWREATIVALLLLSALTGIASAQEFEVPLVAFKAQ